MTDGRAGCCGKRPEITRGASIEEIAELALLVQRLPPESPTEILRYGCRTCGQIWEQHRLPFMHADVNVVVKEGVVPDLGPPPVYASPVAEPESQDARDLRIESRIFFSVSITAGVIGLLTRPSSGELERGVHFAWWLLGGVATGLALVLVR